MIICDRTGALLTREYFRYPVGAPGTLKEGYLQLGQPRFLSAEVYGGSRNVNCVSGLWAWRIGRRTVKIEREFDWSPREESRLLGIKNKMDHEKLLRWLF